MRTITSGASNPVKDVRSARQLTATSASAISRGTNSSRSCALLSDVDGRAGNVETRFGMLHRSQRFPARFGVLMPSLSESVRTRVRTLTPRDIVVGAWMLLTSIQLGLLLGRVSDVESSADSAAQEASAARDAAEQVQSDISDLDDKVASLGEDLSLVRFRVMTRP